MSPVQGDAAGASWGPDDSIVFATADRTTGLQRVSADGGTPTVLTRPSFERGERDHVWPEFLPGGGAVLFTVWSAATGADAGRIAVLDLRTDESEYRVLRGVIGTDARYVSSGHLLYGVAGSLHAVAFDRQRLQPVGTPVEVLEDVATTAVGAVNAALAGNGSLVFVQGAADNRREVLLVDRDGTSSPLPNLEPGPYRHVRVSPDGSRMALSVGDEARVHEFSSGRSFPATRDPRRPSHPLWSPDGHRLVFTSSRSGFPELFWRPADGSGDDELLLSRSTDLTDLIANDWSEDGESLLFTEVPPNVRGVLGQVTVGSPSDAKIILRDALMAAVSPEISDGRRRSIVYQSPRMPHPEIFIERYPELGGRRPVSNGTGERPVWSDDGNTLFFASSDGRRVYAAAVQHGPPLIVDRPRPVFEGSMLTPQFGLNPYDVLPDNRIVVIVRGEAEGAGGAAPGVELVQNWLEELKQLVPVD